MLGELARRLLWIPPTVIVVTLLAFALLSGAPRTDGTSAAFSHLPRFINLSPNDVRTSATSAIATLNNGDSAEARASLAELGGAALPIVLPALDGLSPEPRERVAAALGIVARRMGLLDPRNIDAVMPASAWVRFWDDRSVDFRPSSIRRAVRRYAEHPSPSRRRELETLDTAALDEIFAVLGRDGPLPARDVARRLAQVTSHALGLAEVTDDATDEQIVRNVADLRATWLAHRLSFVALDGAGRAAAVALETQYGKWAARAVAGNLGISRDGRPVLAVLAERGGATSARMFLGLSLGLLLGTALAFLSVVAGRSFFDRGILALLVALAAAPALLLAAIAGSPRLAALATISATVALVASRRIRATLLDAADAPHVTAARARGASFARALLPALERPAIPLFFTLVALELPIALSAAFVAERLFGVAGLGEVATKAVTDGDLSMLMALAVSGTIVTTLAVALGDTAQSLGDPRLSAVKRRTGSG